jgi:tetratricopeptide (TPR) repeat protein
VEKKLDQSKEIKLKPVAEAEPSSSSPQLVAASPELVEPAIDNTSAAPGEPADGVVESHGASVRANGSTDGAPAVRANKSLRLSHSTFRKTFALIAFSASFVAVNNGLKSFWNSPMAPQLTVFGGTSIFSAWCGDPDAAYALQSLPLVINDLSIDPQNTRGAISPARRAALIASLDRFVGNSPVGSRELSKLTHAIVLANNGRPKEAAALLAELQSENPLVSSLRASVLAMIGDYPAALAECDRGIDFVASSKGMFGSSSCETLWELKAQILLAMGRPEEALSVLELPNFPESSREWALKQDSIKNLKAAAYLKLGQPNQAIITACQAGRLNHTLLSIAYLMRGDIQEAKQQAGDSSLALSRIYSQSGQLQEALKYAKLADDAKFGLHAREQHVYVLNQLGRYREALALCQDLSKFAKVNYLTEIMEHKPQLYADMAWSYARLGQSKEALALAESVLNNNPSNKQALEAAKLASQLDGNNTAVEEFDKRLKALNPHFYNRPIIFYEDVKKKGQV